ncbi:DUF3862 domain-containing protein [Enterococcus sp. LJL51]|uniref:DUF3862 domain-containing protein n=1 Tax=Enterococcus sp. LJL51 TaxID=3416656 RepID=UPI003CF6A2A7
MGRKEDRRAMQKKPVTKKWWFWFLLLLLLGGGGFAAVKFIPIELPFGNTASKDSSAETTEETTKTSTPAEPTTDILAKYAKIQLGDPLVEDVKGSSFDDVVGLLGDPSSNVDSELSGAQTKMAIWNKFNGKTTISVNFKDNFATGKNVSNLVSETKEKPAGSKFEGIATDGSYTYEQAVKDLGTPDSLTDALVNGVTAVTAFWTTDNGQSWTIHFDDGAAVSVEQVN